VEHALIEGSRRERAAAPIGMPPPGEVLIVAERGRALVLRRSNCMGSFMQGLAFAVAAP